MNPNGISRSRWLGLSLVTVLALAIGALAPLPAHAQESAALSWTLPTQYANGTPLPASAITGFDVECSSFTPTGGTSGACPIAGGTAVGTATTLTLTGTIPVVGGSACFRARTRAATGVSAWTNTACKTFAAVPPNPPGSFTVAVVIGVNVVPAYRVNADGTRGTAVLGFVPVGVRTSSPRVYTYRGRDYCRVDPSAVKWWATTPTANVAAACG